ncbi:ectonucleotide pyrophosphatase/phosphodiesterase [Flavobacterium agricola]|uniref:Ectonucleotide pyrophosphatase/phosphodiesterase n=1 Tax=Flavobacterium agricola TaxID=2870839 RepID=A0ABY6M3L2_9FLAO|nr:ectonucleotide pyrophosphatase/phosphodiesterase [Flavobacterium agricola]UYW01598.1 ectonucleotide pyrophosphatase/phosphodiesterase [Flavobacterium agricola]
MKKTILLLSCLVTTAVFAQKQQIDTAQIVIPNRINAEKTLEKPYVILISIDGYRYDYTDKYSAKNIKQMADSGVKAKAMIPSYPTITFPNHWSIITGLYPAHHGIVDNFFIDEDRKESYQMSNADNAEDGTWYGGNPLWSLAEGQGVVSASLQWVGSASDAGGNRPTYYYRYHEKFTPEQKVDKVVDWLKLPADQRPHFISLYFPEVDSAGHHFGPDSEQTEQAVQLIDQAIGKLITNVNALHLPNVNFVIVSDHGMKKVNKDEPIRIPAMLLNKDKYEYINSQSLLRVHVKDKKDIKATYKALKKNKTKDYQVYLAKKFPKNLHFSTKDDVFNRIGDIFLVPDAPHIFLENFKKTTTGKHGYNPYAVPEMKAIFYANGPEFKAAIEIDAFENVNVYPLIAEILDLEVQQPIDGKIEVLENILQ